MKHSLFPVPVVCTSEMDDWLRSVTGCLRWNLRDHQKAWTPKGEETPKKEEPIKTVQVCF